MSADAGEGDERKNLLIESESIRRSPNTTCFICFEDIPKIESHLENQTDTDTETENILTMSDCGCREYVHPQCIGQWIETHYEYPQREIRCPICNTNGIIQTPQPFFTRSMATITIQRFFSRFQRNQTQHFNQLLLLNPLNPLNPRHHPHLSIQQGHHQGQQGHNIDMKRFLAISCAMFSIVFILLWILFIFDVSK